MLRPALLLLAMLTGACSHSPVQVEIEGGNRSGIDWGVVLPF